MLDYLRPYITDGNGNKAIDLNAIDTFMSI